MQRMIPFEAGQEEITLGSCQGQAASPASSYAKSGIPCEIVKSGGETFQTRLMQARRKRCTSDLELGGSSAWLAFSVCCLALGAESRLFHLPTLRQIFADGAASCLFQSTAQMPKSAPRFVARRDAVSFGAVITRTSRNVSLSARIQEGIFRPPDNSERAQCRRRRMP
jgi:hypothetical protein